MSQYYCNFASKQNELLQKQMNSELGYFEIHYLHFELSVKNKHMIQQFVFRYVYILASKNFLRYCIKSQMENYKM